MLRERLAALHHWLTVLSAGTTALKVSNECDVIKVKGIYNVGNSCYLSVILQLLATSSTFVNYISTFSTTATSTSNNTYFINELCNCLRAIRNGRDYVDVYNPSKILTYMKKANSSIMVGTNSQHDAHEVFSILLTMLSTMDKGDQSYSLVPKESMMHTRRIENPLIGMISNTLTCQSCSRRRPIKHESFTSIILPIPITNKAVDLYDCFEAFTQDEELQDPIECLACSLTKTKTALVNRIKAYDSLNMGELKDKELRKLARVKDYHVSGETDEYVHDFDQNFIKITDGDNHKVSVEYTLISKTRTYFRKRAMLSRLPPMLNIMLQRKGINPLTGMEIKRNQYISFPMTLDVAPFCSLIKTNTKYTLQSVIVHEGTADNGHYSIFTRSNENSSDWKWISDTKVSSVTNISAVFNHIKAYMLLYSLSYQGCS